MRPIKFRAWSKKDQCWCGAFSVHKSGLFSEIINAHIEEPQHMAIADCHWQDLNTQDEITLMEFTGLLDKNGKEIYEGDIIQDDNIITAIEWDRSGARFYTILPTNRAWVNCLVIGNIFENPNLLTK